MQTTIVAPRPPPPPTTATAMADIDTVKDLLALSPDGAAAAGKFKRSTLVKALNAAAESGSHFDEMSPSCRICSLLPVLNSPMRALSEFLCAKNGVFAVFYTSRE